MMLFMINWKRKKQKEQPVMRDIEWKLSCGRVERLVKILAKNPKDCTDEERHSFECRRQVSLFDHLL